MVKIFEFSAIHLVADGHGNEMTNPKNIVTQLTSGAPTAVHDAAGAVALSANTKFIKIVGEGTITWGNGVTEDFSGVEFRGVSGEELTIDA